MNSQLKVKGAVILLGSSYHRIFLNTPILRKVNCVLKINKIIIYKQVMTVYLSIVKRSP